MMVSREKKQRIRKLLKEGLDWNYICMTEHCSPNTIQKVNEEREQTIRTRKLKSSRSQALRMYEKGYTPFDIAVKLDISSDEVENYKIQYWRLKGMHGFEQMYKDNKDSLHLIMSIVKEMQVRNISLDQLTHAITLMSSSPQLQNEYQRWNNQIQHVREDYKQRHGELRNIQDELHFKKMELRNTVSENQRIEQIKNINSKKLFEMVSNIIHEMLGDNNTLLNAALRAVILASRKYPDHEIVLMNILNDPNQSIGPELIAGANVFYDDMYRELVDWVIDRINSPVQVSN